MVSDGMVSITRLFRRLYSLTKWRTSREISSFRFRNDGTRIAREKHALSLEQIQRLLPELQESIRTMVLVGLLAGLRVGEILALRWQDVDFVGDQLRVQQAIYRGLIGTPKTKSSCRTIPLPPTLVAALQRHYAASEKRDGLVFVTRNGTPHSDTNLLLRHLKPAGARVGMPWLSWHTLRHTHATLLQQSGATPKEAQAQLGHANVTTTLSIYTHLIPEHQRAAVNNLGELVTNGDELGIWSGRSEANSLILQ
jgi:integrase